MSFSIITDSSCDLSLQQAKNLGIAMVQLSVEVNGATYANDQLDYPVFYQWMRDGASAKTFAANPEQWAAEMKKVLDQGKDVLVLAFSSGLSNTCQAANIAAEELRADYPECRIVVMDTLCASLGEGMIVYFCAKMCQQGKSLDEVIAYAEKNLPKLAHWFTVDDLVYLKRGGRISATTAVVGSLLNIKPVMHVDDAGKLVSVSKARGRKASIEAMIASMKRSAINPSEQEVFISHGDCLKDAEYLAQRVKEEFSVKAVHIGYVGAVIGSHSGPGTLALFFYGTER